MHAFFFLSSFLKNDFKCLGMKLTAWSINTCAALASADVSSNGNTDSRYNWREAYAEPSLFDGANQDHDYYLARAASLRCLETCFPKETTEGQLLSAELFSLLSMCVLAACLWPTDPEQQHETGPPASPPFPHPHKYPPSPISTITEASKYALCKCLKCSYSVTPLAKKRPCRKLYWCEFWFLCVKQ